MDPFTAKAIAIFCVGLIVIGFAVILDRNSKKLAAKVKAAEERDKEWRQSVLDEAERMKQALIDEYGEQPTLYAIAKAHENIFGSGIKIHHIDEVARYRQTEMARAILQFHYHMLSLQSKSV